MPSTSGRSVYVAELKPLGYGFPLWSPSPTETGKVHIGDVGRVKNGAFYRLFNVTHSADDPLNAQYGVPDGFEVLVYDKRLKHKRYNYAPAVLCSKTTTSTVAEARSWM